jgi:hypothetical protein
VKKLARALPKSFGIKQMLLISLKIPTKFSLILLIALEHLNLMEFILTRYMKVYLHYFLSVTLTDYKENESLNYHQSFRNKTKLFLNIDNPFAIIKALNSLKTGKTCVIHEIPNSKTIAEIPLSFWLEGDNVDSSILKGFIEKGGFVPDELTNEIDRFEAMQIIVTTGMPDDDLITSALVHNFNIVNYPKP